ncbi:MAG: adenosylhomocysteinase [Endomicrobia bacterium]|nr:adenosylhomocysteinase [Endomicrobiia bacterium]MDW8055611.1 adenosylhomocysteinase [Elusimicrobiota bacterium]
MNYHIKDIKLARDGLNRIEWAFREMPVLCMIKERFDKEKPLKGIKIGCCLHVTTETANLMLVLKSGGAEVSLCASNPLSTQDDVAAALVKYFKIPVFAIKGENTSVYYSHINSVLNIQPNITMDDGADLVSTLHSSQKYKDIIKNVIGGTEETTTGVIRLKSMAEHNVLKYPIIAVNDAKTKHMFDNKYGTGQSTIDGILRATNILLAGKKFVVCGYGQCGKGVAMRAKGMGAEVIVCEVDPVKALEAVMDGYRVMNLDEAAKIGDVFVTVTGNINVIDVRHFLKMKDSAIVANSGHFNVEINIEKLKQIAVRTRRIKPFVEEFTLKNNKRIYILAEGRLVNLASAEGHPSMVMDMSFSNQALCVEYLVKSYESGKLREKLENKVYPVPKEIDNKVAELKLKSMGVKIDKLTKQQIKYLSSWEMGT